MRSPRHCAKQCIVAGCKQKGQYRRTAVRAQTNSSSASSLGSHHCIAAGTHTAATMPQNWPPVVFLGLVCGLGAEGLEAPRAGGLQDAHSVTRCGLHASLCQRLSIDIALGTEAIINTSSSSCRRGRTRSIAMCSECGKGKLSLGSLTEQKC